MTVHAADFVADRTAMTLVLDRTEPSPPHEGAPPGADVTERVGGTLVIAALASLVAGAMHVGATAAYSGERAAVWTFLSLAIIQVVWGTAALMRPRRDLAVIGITIGGAAATGWLLSKAGGIPGIDGLDTDEPARAADVVAAVLAAVTLTASALALIARRLTLPRPVVAATVLVAAALGVPSVASAVNHDHGAGHVSADGTTQVASAVPPRPFDPRLPIDLSGVDGVTPEEQARAENLLAATVLYLPRWSDPAVAEANGFRSINDGGTGVEHYVNRAFMDNETILDPSEPESLVYDTTETPKKLVAAMYMLPTGSTLEDIPELGGALTQWHIHNNLCFTAEGRVAGLTQGDGSCATGLFKGPETPMIHVWIEPHECGPFSALEGVGAGQTANGETRSCDTVHGSG